MDFTKIDVSKLTKKEQARLYDYIQEYKRRERAKKPQYSPNAGQLSVHQCLKPFKFVFSGNGAGKTAMAANHAIFSLDGYDPVKAKMSPVPCRVLIVLDDPTKVADVWLPELTKWAVVKADQLDKRGKPYVSRIAWPNGSELLFMFHKQEPMLFESIEADVVIFDEPPPRPIYISLIRGLRKLDSEPDILVVGTPIAVPWLRKEVYDPWARGELTDTECFRFASDVNKENVNWSFVEANIFTKYTDKEVRMRRYGEFFDLEGLALADLFSREAHLVDPFEWPSAWPVVVAIDPHPRKSHVACMLGVSEQGELVYLKEMASRAVPSQFAEDLKEFYRGYRVVDIVCDSLGSSELTGGQGNLSFIQVLRDNGVRVRATTYDEKQDEAFIQMIQEVLAIPLEPDNMGRQEPRLKLLKTCRGIIGDIESVEWQKYRNMDEYKPRLAIASKDFLSALKYALATELSFDKGEEKVIRSQGTVGWGSSRVPLGNNRRKLVQRLRGEVYDD